MTDEDIEDLNRGGHDPGKVYNAYKAAYECKEKPTVILAFTVKGYGIGSRQADNTTHQVKKLSEENLNDFIKKFKLPLNKKQIRELNYLEFKKDSKEHKYLISQRKKLGGFLPKREASKQKLIMQSHKHFEEFNGISKREMSTTMVFVRLITSLLRDKKIGKHIVPIVQTIWYL